jgi:hypothetical protein
MAKDLSRHFFQRRYTNDQQAYEEILKVTSHLGNTIQNHDETLPTPAG